MIVFCEDCGKKNHLPATVSENGRLKFRCAACGYLNNYSLARPSPDEADKPDEKAFDGFETLLRQIRRIKQIQGFFVFHIDKGVIHSEMPGMLKASDVSFLGKHIIHAYLIGKQRLDGISDMQLAVGAKTLVIRQIRAELFIIMTGADPNLADTIRTLPAGWTEATDIPELAEQRGSA